jgi:hypothetical protein
MDHSRMLLSYHQGIEEFINVLPEFPKKMWDYKPAPNRWSIKEIILHMADSEANSYVRCRKIIAENGSNVMGYDQDKWAENLKYKDQNIETSLELFKQLRLNTYNLLLTISDDKWENYCMHPEHGRVTLGDWLKTYTDHVHIHISQMRDNHDEWKKLKSTKA